MNLIGEYTDFNEGFVLPVAIGLEIRIAFVPTDDRRVELTLEAKVEHYDDGAVIFRQGDPVAAVMVNGAGVTTSCTLTLVEA